MTRMRQSYNIYHNQLSTYFVRTVMGQFDKYVIKDLVKYDKLLLDYYGMVKLIRKL